MEMVRKFAPQGGTDLRSKRVTRRALLHIHKSLIISILHCFKFSFFTEFASNALENPINRLIFASNIPKKEFWAKFQNSPHHIPLHLISGKKFVQRSWTRAKII
ncbi:hypothetical protein JM83_2926 [Gillisia sp. Hel_I_86]|nr:hypothetical protein JM83_2926 [Gillisia sp. Hel_I_86]